MSQSVQYRLQRKIKREFKLFNASSRCVTLPMEPNVEYPLLAEGHIRPLKVSTAEDNLTFELYSALLDDNQKFRAISYAWGSSNLTHHIPCNGKVMRVTRSVAEMFISVTVLDLCGEMPT